MHVIYITGLGDNQPTWQIRVVTKVWKIYGVTPHFFRVGWAEGSLSDKLTRLDKLITDLHGKDQQPIGIVSVSAGASLALHAFVAHADAVSGVVTVCGKIANPDKVLASVRRQNPAFAESMVKLPETLNALTPKLRKRIFCVYPLTDRIVATQDQRIDGAHARRVYSFGHVFSIALQLTFGARKNVKFLQRRADASVTM